MVGQEGAGIGGGIRGGRNWWWDKRGQELVVGQEGAGIGGGIRGGRNWWWDKRGQELVVGQEGAGGGGRDRKEVRQMANIKR